MMSISRTRVGYFETAPKRRFPIYEVVTILLVGGIVAALLLGRFEQLKARAERAEAYVLVRAIHVAQSAFASRNDVYAEIPKPEGNVDQMDGRVPWTNEPCDALCDSSHAHLCNRFSCIGFKAYTQVRFAYWSHAYSFDPDDLPEVCIGAKGILSSGEKSSHFYVSHNNLKPVFVAAQNSCTAQKLVQN